MRQQKHTPMTKAQLREAINGLGSLAPDWLVEALEDFIALQEAHEDLLSMHAEDAYHLDAARARAKELEAQRDEQGFEYSDRLFELQKQRDGLLVALRSIAEYFDKSQCDEIDALRYSIETAKEAIAKIETGS